jgi:glc operon protein GlcG
MSSNIAEIAIEAPLPSNPLDVIPAEIPFDVPYGLPISLEQAQAVIQAAVAEARKRNWKMNIAVADSGGNLVAFQRMDGAMLASIQIAQHKARAAVTFRRPRRSSRMASTLCTSTICSPSMESSRLEAASH